MQSNEDLARYARNYRARHPERIRAYEREYKRQRRVRDPEPVRKYERRAYGERKRYSRYGVSPEWFRDQLVGHARDSAETLEKAIAYLRRETCPVETT